LPAVLQSIDVLNDLSYSVPNDALLTGIENVINRTGLLGRWQILGHDPLIICDTGHNEDGIREVVNQVNKMIYKNLHFIFGVVSDKNVDPVLGLLPGNAQYYFCKAGIPRAMDAVTLRQKAAMHGLHGQAYPSVAEAFKTAKASAEINDLIFIGGSTFVVAEVL
jgi:dihydrofolate synthase/folylpolyglutamate synthase